MKTFEQALQDRLATYAPFIVKVPSSRIYTGLPIGGLGGLPAAIITNEGESANYSSGMDYEERLVRISIYAGTREDGRIARVHARERINRVSSVLDSDEGACQSISRQGGQILQEPDNNWHAFDDYLVRLEETKWPMR